MGILLRVEANVVDILGSHRIISLYLTYQRKEWEETELPILPGSMKSEHRFSFSVVAGQKQQCLRTKAAQFSTEIKNEFKVSHLNKTPLAHLHFLMFSGFFLFEVPLLNFSVTELTQRSCIQVNFQVGF